MANQVDTAIARLRLLLAGIEQKDRQLRTTQRQFREQMERVISFALYREPTLEQTLSMMAEVSQRGQFAQQTPEHLQRLRARVVDELNSLQLTKGIEAAKIELADREMRKAEIEARMHGMDGAPGGAEALNLPSVDELAAQIRRLQALINEASEQAVRSLTASKLDR